MKDPFKPNETAIKKMIKQFLALKGIFNYPNIQGLGSYPGVPDRTLHPYGLIVYLEIKQPGKDLSKKQQEFKDQCDRDGVPHWTVHSVEELEEKLKELEEKLR